MNLVDSHTDISKVDFKEGAMILVDKPMEWSSFSVVNKIRWVLRHHYQIKKIKVGHGGTLDPLATGLMLIFTGGHTKLINDYMGMDKSYNSDIKLGAVTASFDAEQPEEEIKSADHITEEMVLSELETFRGEQDQAAPIFSALKVNGQPMYKMARQGIKLDRKVRKVIFHDLSLNSYNNPSCNIDITCSKGTYIRSFAHDLGQQLGVGGYLSGLRRMSIGPFHIDDAVTIDKFVSNFKN